MGENGANPFNNLPPEGGEQWTQGEDPYANQQAYGQGQERGANPYADQPVYGYDQQGPADAAPEEAGPTALSGGHSIIHRGKRYGYADILERQDEEKAAMRGSDAVDELDSRTRPVTRDPRDVPMSYPSQELRAAYADVPPDSEDAPAPMTIAEFMSPAGNDDPAVLGVKIQMARKLQKSEGYENMPAASNIDGSDAENPLRTAVEYYASMDPELTPAEKRTQESTGDRVAAIRARLAEGASLRPPERISRPGAAVQEVYTDDMRAARAEADTLTSQGLPARQRRQESGAAAAGSGEASANDFGDTSDRQARRDAAIAATGIPDLDLTPQQWEEKFRAASAGGESMIDGQQSQEDVPAKYVGNHRGDPETIPDVRGVGIAGIRGTRRLMTRLAQGRHRRPDSTGPGGRSDGTRPGTQTTDGTRRPDNRPQ